MQPTISRKTTRTRKPVHVLLVGGGFGGRYAARRLAYRLPPGSRLTLVDRNSYMLYTPMLTETAGRSVSPRNIAAPNRDLPRCVRVVQQEIVSADLPGRSITLADGTRMEADHIVFALGSTTNYRNIEGARKYSLTMKTLDDARRVQAIAQRHVELAAMESDPERRKLLLSFVVAGGGYTGVETIAALNDLVRDTAEQHGIGAEELRLTLVEPAKRLMAEMPEPLADYSEDVLRSDGIDVKVDVGVSKVNPDSLELTDGTTLPAGLLIWDTGIIPNPLVEDFDCLKGKKGGIDTDSAFRVRGRPGIWAIGDCAEIPKPDGSGAFFEPTAQNATRQGALVADNILAVIHGRCIKPFTFKQVGELAVISRYRGVANVFGVRIRGFAGWLLWRAIYLAKMPGLAARLGILSDWIKLLFGRGRVPTAFPREMRPISAM